MNSISHSLPGHRPAALFLSLVSMSISLLAPELPAHENMEVPVALDSPVMLSGEWVPANPQTIDFDALPRIPLQHAVISDVRSEGRTRVNQHNYLTHFAGRYWAMWSDGPGVARSHSVVPGHDQEGQRVSFATSEDGLNWSAIGDLSGPPDDGYGWIARGFWIREGKLIALASRYLAPAYYGEGLSLHAFTLEDDGGTTWKHLGVVFDDAMNNFSPKLLSNGEWMMTRRDHLKTVHILRGGVQGFDHWQSFPLISDGNKELAAEEPYWWQLPSGALVALFRDNKRSGYLFRAFSTDFGHTWSKPVRTNFPDATSKFHAAHLSDGRYVLVSNSNPQRRDPLTLAISADGIEFDRLLYLVGGRHIDYPFVMQHDGYIFVAFAGAKQTVEVLRIKISDLPDEQPPQEFLPSRL